MIGLSSPCFGMHETLGAPAFAMNFSHYWTIPVWPSSFEGITEDGVKAASSVLRFQLEAGRPS